MIPDATQLEAYKPILDLGLAGSIIIFLMVAWAWTVRLWLAERKERDGLQAEYLAYAKEQGAIGVDMKNVTAGNIAVTQAQNTAIAKLADEVTDLQGGLTGLRDGFQRVEREIQLLGRGK